MFTNLFLTPQDGDYPELLRHIPQPPKRLYYRGDCSLLNHPHLLAIVGSRKITPYGAAVVRDAVAGVVARGVVTVSGLAFGVDQAVHTETLAAGGRTIAVLGSAVTPSEVAPRSNARLAERIIESGGVIVSEYPPGTTMQSHFFPIRNRIIAGLCSATVVIEASQKSGSLITARYAVECGRDVYAVPGSIFSPLSVGTNSLLERGAIPWLSCASFFGDIQYQQDSASLANLDADSAVLVQACTESPQTIDQLIESTGFSAAHIMQSITLLLLNGTLRDLGDNTYVH